MIKSKRGKHETSEKLQVDNPREEFLGARDINLNLKVEKGAGTKNQIDNSVLPLPPLHITALESPTFATSKRSPTRMAVEAVDPASLFWLFSDFRNSESVWLYASAAETCCISFIYSFIFQLYRKLYRQHYKYEITNL